jgi:hypothetical protein
MAAKTLPPIPQDKIGENLQWREWFRNLGTYIQSIQIGDFTLDVLHGGTGATNLLGYLKGNGSSPITGQAQVPYTDVSGLSTVAHTGAYTDLSGTPSPQPAPPVLSHVAAPPTATDFNTLVDAVNQLRSAFITNGLLY